MKIALLIAAFSACTARAQSQDMQMLPSPLTFASFGDLVARSHPEAGIDRQTVEQARLAEGRSGLLSDPQMSVSRDRVPLPERRQKSGASDMPGGQRTAELGPSWSISLQQSFPWPGTLRAEDQAARAVTSLSKATAALASAGRRFAAEELFLSMIRTAKLLEVQRASLKEAESVRDFAHARFRQGIGSHMEFVHTHSETAVLAANIASLATDLLNLKAHALALAGFPESLEPDAVAFDLAWPKDLVDLTSRPKSPAATARGDTDYGRARIAQARAAELAREEAEYRRSLPSFMASGMVMREDTGMRMGGGMVGVTVPIFSAARRTSLGSAMRATASRSDEQLAWHDRKKRLALGQADRRIAQIAANARSLRDGVIPPVKEHLAAATTEYSHGKGSIDTIIDGRKTLLNLEQGEIQALEALARAHLSRERIVAGLTDIELDEAVPQVSVGAEGSMALGGGMGG